jgi:flagella basal body P-ring formation protein FlgA
MAAARCMHRWLLCVPLAVLSMAAQASTVKIDLRDEVLLSGPRMVLSDLAKVDAGDARLTQAIAALPVGSAPLAGHVDRRSRAELEVALRGRQFPLGQRIEWQGARSVTIRRESRALDPALPLAEAVRHVSAVFGPDYAALELSLATPLAELALPSGQVEYRARAIERQSLRARLPVWVDVFVDGALYRSVVVTLAVVARQEVYVARRALAEGDTVTAQDVVLGVRDVAGLADAAIKPEALAGAPRLRGALAQGQVLTVRQVAPAGMVMRGDRVAVEVRNHGILLETVAVAQADGQLGQMVPVKLQQSSEAVSAKVIAPGQVRIDGR